MSWRETRRKHSRIHGTAVSIGSEETNTGLICYSRSRSKIRGIGQICAGEPPDVPHMICSASGSAESSARSPSRSCHAPSAAHPGYHTCRQDCQDCQASTYSSRPFIFRRAALVPHLIRNHCFPKLDYWQEPGLFCMQDL
jgi:hypothetical protein